jgi:hypothetical protein
VFNVLTFNYVPYGVCLLFLGMYMCQKLVGIFPKMMEMLESKRKRLQFLDNEGCVVKNSPFTTIALKNDYEVNIHEDKNNDDLCFILWLW